MWRQSWDLGNKTIERIHINIAGPCNGSHYFVVVDAYSKLPKIFEIPNISKLTEMLGICFRQWQAICK